MTRSHDLESLIIGAHALTRTAAVDMQNETPSAQWRTLAILLERGPLRLGDLARLSRVTQPGMTRLVATMTEAGLLERAHDPDDQRAVIVAATDEGSAAYAAWRRELVAALLPRFSGLDDDDWRALGRAAEILREQLAEATTSHPHTAERGSSR
ncbi:MarR family winged helix-turn-helix transcriptional regulator [Microbacterium indicum]|uniref:MarR family winged helix-turn-helix transcriptional regulator n=1 Tax=Microbacterium indicum TaxID=358100 RepID=UPI0006881329|nr:MarR family transcriptional regulator [Microbacterium indicum]